MERPEFISDEHLECLDELRESGEINMYGARPYLVNTFPYLTNKRASEILQYWKDSFGNTER